MPDSSSTPIVASPHPPVPPAPGRFEREDGTEPASAQPATGGSAQPQGTAAANHKMPSLARQAWNLARSLADFVADGCKTVSADQYRERLEICDACDHRRNNRCTKCGCRLSLKAQGRAFKCPEGQWPAVACDQEQ